MPKGGARPGAGRKPGAKDKAAAAEVQSLSALARTHTAKALQALVTVAGSSLSDAARVSAATAILDRGYGRPMQQHEVGGKNGGAIKHDFSGLNDDQLGQLATLLEQVVTSGRPGGGSEGGTGGAPAT